jgi:glycosyltransferase involved in cell wall biosynthesis/multidrug transporter EmrE-like cation transporter
VRILVVSSYPPRACGIGAYARDQVRTLREAGNEVTVLSPPDGDGDVKVVFFGGRPFFRASKMAPGFDRVIVHFQPALYYRPRRPLSRVLTSFGLLWLVLRRRQAAVLVHEADTPVLWRPDYLLLREAFRGAPELDVHTDAERRALEASYRISVRARVVPHRALPVSEVAPSASGGGPDDPVAFLCAGFIQASKGFDQAVRAFAEAFPSRNGARLDVVGSVRDRTPENERHLAELRTLCQATPGVRLLDGYVDDGEFDAMISRADWVVLPYRRSWSSGVLARAHALGTPAIVSAVGGLGEQAEEHDRVVSADGGGLVAAFREAADATTRDRLSHDDVTPDVTSSIEDGLAAPASAHHTSDWDTEFQPPLPKKGKGMLFGFIFLSVVLAAAAQITLKHGMTQVTHHGALPLDLKQPLTTLRRIATNLPVVLGLGTFVLSAAVWLIVLSKVRLSFAYPFVSLTYVLILVFDRVVNREGVPALGWIGVALIIGGILAVSRTQTG